MGSKSKKFNWQIIFIIALSITLISITIFVVNKEKKNIASQEPETVYVGYDSDKKLENFSRTDSVNAMQEILLSIKEDVEGKDRTIEERMEALDDGEVDIKEVINEKTIDMLYMSEEFNKSEFNRQFAASVLLTYHQLIVESTESDDFSPLIDSFEEIVYLDSKLMTAHIPLDVYIGENKGIAFEMQYIDGEWKFNPYTSMMSLVMVVNYEGQIEELFNNQEESSKDPKKDNEKIEPPSKENSSEEPELKKEKPDKDK